MVSMASVTVIHSQNLTTLFIVGIIIQGIVTLEIARRLQNIIGSWIIHGSNQFFVLVFLPLFI
jgi:hypothetical protein